MQVPRRRWAVLAAVLAVAAALGYGPAWRHVRAASLLARFSSDTPGRLGRIGAYDVDEALAPFTAASGEIPARLYSPHGLSRAPGMVLVHGVHHLGMDEPRLVRFARTLASAGVVILTPQVRELADYAVDAKSIDTLGAAVHALSARVARPGTPAPRVGLMGLSFAGGLALVTASEPKYQADIGLVVAVGAHDDLGRVSRFFATNKIEEPDGTVLSLKAHPYGLLVLAYENAADFFSAQDLAGAKDSLRAWLWEDKAAAERIAGTLSTPAQRRLTAFFEDNVELFRVPLIQCIQRDEATLAAVSPAGHLQSLRAPVLLVHGAGDTVIPASETRWLAKGVPQSLLRGALISRALQHVELDGQPGWKDEWELIHFMANVLKETDGLRP